MFALSEAKPREQIVPHSLVNDMNTSSLPAFDDDPPTNRKSPSCCATTIGNGKHKK